MAESSPNQNRSPFRSVRFGAMASPASAVDNQSPVQNGLDGIVVESSPSLPNHNSPIENNGAAPPSPAPQNSDPVLASEQEVHSDSELSHSPAPNAQLIPNPRQTEGKEDEENENKTICCFVLLAIVFGILAGALGAYLYLLFAGKLQTATSALSSNDPVPVGGALSMGSKERLVMQEDFETLGPINTDKWIHYLAMDGADSGTYSRYVNNRTVSFQKDGMLHIRPTYDGSSRSLSSSADLMSAFLRPAMENVLGASASDLLMNTLDIGTARQPSISSAKILLSSGSKADISAGRVEIRCKMPKGNFLRPEFKLIPRSSVYGAFPASGEMLINQAFINATGAFSQKAGFQFGSGPDQIVSSIQDRGEAKNSSAFRVYGIAWNSTHIISYIDDSDTSATGGVSATKLNTMQITHVNLLQTLAASTSLSGSNSTVNLWSTMSPSISAANWNGGSGIAPFDKSFYLSIGLAVGGADFPTSKTGVSSTPWLSSSNPARDFVAARSLWLPSWPSNDDRNLQIDWVRIWTLDQ